MFKGFATLKQNLRRIQNYLTPHLIPIRQKNKTETFGLQATTDLLKQIQMVHIEEFLFFGDNNHLLIFQFKAELLTDCKISIQEEALKAMNVLHDRGVKVIFCKAPNFN